VWKQNLSEGFFCEIFSTCSQEIVWLSLCIIADSQN